MNWETLAAELERTSVDLLIATSPENIRYASGYKSFQGVWNRFAKAVVVSPAHPRPVLVLPVAEAPQIAGSEARPGCDIVFFGGSQNLVLPSELQLLDADDRWIGEATLTAKRSAVEAIVHALGMFRPSGRVAVDGTGATELLPALSAAGTAYLFAGRGEDLWRLVRMVKTPTEVAKLHAAASLNERAIGDMVANLTRMDETELEAAFRRVVGGGGGHVQHWIGGAGRGAGSYRLPRRRVSQPGERFRFDIGVELDGYCSDLGGTVQVGAAPSDEERRVYDALTAGIDEGISEARAGRRTSQLYAAVLAAIRKSGLPDYRFSLVGHGIGVEPRDYPIIGPPMPTASPFMESPFDPLLRAGMVLNIETPLNRLGEGSYQHEVTLVVEEGGGRLLSPRRDYAVATGEPS